METAPDPNPPPLPAAPVVARRNTTTLKLLIVATLVLLFQFPLYYVGTLQQERRANRASGRDPWAESGSDTTRRGPTDRAVTIPVASLSPVTDTFEAYRMVERALKYNVLVLVLVFAAFFLFETLGGLRLHAIHYGLVGAAMCLFYLALLAVGEVVPPGWAYIIAAIASSALITLYSMSILRSRDRAIVIGLLLTCVHGVLYVVLRMENFALLAGTATLFAALAAVMWFTRNVDWSGSDSGEEAAT